jgi:hypothetical protein
MSKGTYLRLYDITLPPITRPNSFAVRRSCSPALFAPPKSTERQKRTERDTAELLEDVLLDIDMELHGMALEEVFSNASELSHHLSQTSQTSLGFQRTSETL